MGRPKVLQDKTCQNCQKIFSPRMSRNKYCSTKCRNEGHRTSKRQEIIELLKDKKLSMAQIAEIVNMTKQYISLVYKSQKNNLPERSGGWPKKPKTLKDIVCPNCQKIFSPENKYRKFCSVKCRVESSKCKIQWPETIIVKTTLTNLAKELGISYPCLRKKLIDSYNWTEENFRAVDTRRK